MIRKFLADIDLTVTLSDLGITAEDIDWMTENCLKVSAGNLLNTPVKVEEADIHDLYRRAL
jgi:alcohol dehydrogenase class IV